MEIRILVDGETVRTRISSVRESTRDVRILVAAQLRGRPAALVDAALIVASELVENVLKYGQGDDDSLEVFMQGDRLVVRTVNVVQSLASAERSLEILDVIRSRSDPETLYVDAIDRGLLEARSGVSQQGFYRIAAVAGFELSGRIEEDRLVIEAVLPADRTGEPGRSA